MLNIETWLPIATTIIGLIASLGYFSQAHEMIKMHSSRDVSLLTYVVFGLSVVFWMLYGVYLHNYPLIITGVVSTIGACVVIAVYFYERKTEKAGKKKIRCKHR